MYRLKTTHMKNINIPKPCSENWNEMSPSQKGAFCKKCAIDVYDFTNKSGDEIRDILTLNIGSRVCGRINPVQLEDLNTDFSAWQMNNKQSFQRAWLFTLFVVFGMTLFSCEEDEVLNVQKLQEIGQVILINTDKSDTIEVNSTKGQIRVDPKAKNQQSTSRGLNPNPREIEMLGEMEYVEPLVKGEIEVVETGIDTERPIYHMAGGMVATDVYNEYLIERTNDRVIPESLVAEEISGRMYPNPAQNETTLKVNMPSRENTVIELVGLNGQIMRSIYNGKLKKGESEFVIDVSALDSGFYLVIIISGETKRTLKLSKM